MRICFATRRWIWVCEPATEASVDEILARYRAAGSTIFAVQPSPSAAPGDLPAWLPPAAYRCATTGPRSIARQRPMSSSGPICGLSASTGARGPFAEISCTAFGLPVVMQSWLAAGVGQPGWAHYLAFDGEMPVAGGALFVKGDVGWLGIASTLPAAAARRARRPHGAPHPRCGRIGLPLGRHRGRRGHTGAPEPLLSQHAAHRLPPGLSTAQLHRAACVIGHLTPSAVAPPNHSR